MLKSLFRELTGASLKDDDPCPSLAPFRDKCHVVVVFEVSNDDRPLRQEEALVPYERTLADHDIAVLRVAGGGVFQLFENPFDLRADEIRKDLDGPSDDDFEVVLIGRDGSTKFRSRKPLPVTVIMGVIEALPGSAS